MLDDKDLLRAYLKGIRDGVDFVFQTLIQAGFKSFELENAERYRNMVYKAMDAQAIVEKLRTQ